MIKMKYTLELIQNESVISITGIYITILRTSSKILIYIHDRSSLVAAPNGKIFFVGKYFRKNCLFSIHNIHFSIWLMLHYDKSSKQIMEIFTFGHEYR